jgi:hypothetical protein
MLAVESNDDIRPLPRKLPSVLNNAVAMAQTRTPKMEVQDTVPSQHKGTELPRLAQLNRLV